MSDDYDDDDGQVGYGRPPKHTQFKKGQSGNPKGRSRPNKSIKDILRSELEERVTVSEGGRRIRVSKLDLLIKSQITEAIRGSASAMRAVLTLIKTHGLDREDAFQPDGSSETYVLILERIQYLLDMRGHTSLYLPHTRHRGCDERQREMIDRITADRDGTLVLVGDRG